MEWSRRHIWAVILLSCLVFWGHFGDRHQRRRLSACHRIAIPPILKPAAAGYFLSLAHKKRYKTVHAVQKQPKIVIKNTVLKSDQY